ASENETDEQLVNKIINNLNKRTLVKTIAFVVADTHKLINNNKGSDESYKKTVDTIAAGIAQTAKLITENPDYKAQIKADILQQVELKGADKGNYKRTVYNAKQKQTS